MSSLTIEVDDPEDAYENLRAMLDAAPVEFSQITAVRLELEYEPKAGDDAGPEQTAEDDGADDDVDDATRRSMPPIADAESPDDATSDADDAGGPSVDGAEEISFRKPGEDEQSDDRASVFGDPDESRGDDSVFSPPEDAVTFEDPDASDDAGATQTTDDGRPLGDAVDRSTSGRTQAGDAAESTDGRTAREGRAVQPSPQTYNKVVRLLQNRDFPIERGEIEDVAVGAYDVDVEECRSVIDAAIEKGLVAQEGSKLVDPTG